MKIKALHSRTTASCDLVQLAESEDGQTRGLFLPRRNRWLATMTRAEFARELGQIPQDRLGSEAVAWLLNHGERLRRESREQAPINIWPKRSIPLSQQRRGRQVVTMPANNAPPVLDVQG